MLAQGLWFDGIESNAAISLNRPVLLFLCKKRNTVVFTFHPSLHSHSSDEKKGREYKMNKKTLFLVEVAVLGALAYLLDLVSAFICKAIWPEGGSVSLAMIPIFLMAYRWGLKGGLLTGFILGTLQVVTGFSVFYHPVQGIVDYFVAFTVIGLAGIFAKQIKTSIENGNIGKWTTYTVLGVFLGSLLRFLAHFYTGIVFFGSYAPKGQPVALYSLIYNGTYMSINFVLSSVLVVMILFIAPRLVQIKK